MFEKNGGLSKWNTIHTLKYKKSYVLYLESGQVEKSVDQIHDYTFNPEAMVSILTNEGGDIKELIFRNGQITEVKNDTINDTVDQETLMRSMQSSVFVISQPFKLADKGSELSYEGLDTLVSGEVVHVLKSSYDATTSKYLTTSDIWWLYFDQDSYIMTGYLVKHLDHFSLVKNLESFEVEGVHFPKKRKSWRVDKHGNVLYLRAKYEYRDFEMIF